MKHLQDMFINTSLTAEKYRKFSNTERTRPVFEIGLYQRQSFISIYISVRCLSAFLSVHHLICCWHCLLFKLNISSIFTRCLEKV